MSIKEQIKKKLEELRELRELEEKERVEKVRAGITDNEVAIAELLHKKACRWNHTDGCGWFYEKGWDDDTHKEYLKKARALLLLVDYSVALKVINALY